MPACAGRWRGTCRPESWEAVDGLVTEDRCRAHGLETAQPWFPISPGGVIPFSAGACPLRFRAVSALHSEAAGRPAVEDPVLPVQDALVSLQRGFHPPAQGPPLRRPVLLAASSPHHPCWRPPLGGELGVLLSRPSPDCQPLLPGAPGDPPLLRCFLCLI